MIHSASLRATGSEMLVSTWVASSGLCLRTSSITFSSVSLSPCGVDDVAATAAGSNGLRGGCSAACCRGADGMLAVGPKPVSLSPGFLVSGFRSPLISGLYSALASALALPSDAAASLVPLPDPDLGTALREIGRGLGTGILSVAQASPPRAARLAASDID